MPESNQHKQSNFSANTDNNSAKNFIAVFVLFVAVLCDHFAFYFFLQFLLFSLSCRFFLFLRLLDSYIIKLFDRSVDLAQFNTTTPLYPICRAWMRNNPSVREPAASPSPPHSMVEEEVRRYSYPSSPVSPRDQLSISDSDYVG